MTVNNKQIEDRIRNELEQDVPDVLQQIKESPQFFVPEPEPKWTMKQLFTNRFTLLATSILVIAFILIGVRNNQAPVVASTITLDVNPSIQITLDEDDIVIDVTALNDDGDEIVSKDIAYLGMTIDEVIEVLITRLSDRGYIVNVDSENNIVLLDVSATNETVRSRVELAVKQSLDQELNRFQGGHWILSAGDIKLTAEQQQAVINAMRENPMTRAKLILIYRIHGLDESYSVRALARLTVRQLYAIYIELEDPDNLPFYDQMPGHRDRHKDPYGDGISAAIFS